MGGGPVASMSTLLLAQALLLLCAHWSQGGSVFKCFLTSVSSCSLPSSTFFCPGPPPAPPQAGCGSFGSCWPRFPQPLLAASATTLERRPYSSLWSCPSPRAPISSCSSEAFGLCKPPFSLLLPPHPQLSLEVQHLLIVSLTTPTSVLPPPPGRIFQHLLPFPLLRSPRHDLHLPTRSSSPLFAK